MTLPDSTVFTADQLVAAATNSPVPARRLAQLLRHLWTPVSGSTNLEAAIDWLLAEMRPMDWRTCGVNP